MFRRPFYYYYQSVIVVVASVACVRRFCCCCCCCFWFMAPINCFLVFCARFAASVSVSQLQLHLQQLNDEIYMFYLESNLFKTHLLYAACVLENCLVVAVIYVVVVCDFSAPRGADNSTRSTARVGGGWWWQVIVEIYYQPTHARVCFHSLTYL